MNPNTATPKHVLLADDDEDDRIFFREALDEIPVPTSLSSVNDGDELMKFLNRDDRVADVLFLDLNMPGRNGKDCLREIRMFHHLNKLPVIIFSTSANHRDVDEAFSLGADLYLQKPSGYSLMVQQLQKVLMIDWVRFNRDRKNFLFS
jgi:CheY-like chemotaxis protein